MNTEARSWRLGNAIWAAVLAICVTVLATAVLSADLGTLLADTVRILSLGNAG